VIAILKRAGIDFDESMGLTPNKAVCLDRNGNVVIERPTARTLSGWSRLYRACRASRHQPGGGARRLVGRRNSPDSRDPGG
jgi:hypothetical protein